MSDELTRVVFASGAVVGRHDPDQGDIRLEGRGDPPYARCELCGKCWWARIVVELTEATQ